MNLDPALAPRGEPRIILVGGASATGKTVLAQRIAAHLGMSLAMADDFRLFGQRITSASQVPALHFFVATEEGRRQKWLTVEDALDGLIAIGELVSRGLEIVIAHHLAIGAPLVIEGDSVTPALAAADELAGIRVAGRVRALFLHEPDESRVLANMLARGRGIASRSPNEQARGAHAAWLHGETLAAEARRLGQPVVRSRPFASLFERALTALYAPGAASSSE
jgi:2-phosphoglycerate kinase